MIFLLLFIFCKHRTKPTLSGKQKRLLQDKLEYVQEVVKTKKVGCAFGLRAYLKTAVDNSLMAYEVIAFVVLQKNLYEEYLRQSVGDQDMN